MNRNKLNLSLAARVHIQLSDELAWRGDMTPEAQADLFGIALTQTVADVTIMMMPDSTINVVMLEHGQPKYMTLTMALDDIQSRVERQDEGDDFPNDDFGDGLIAGDGYRSFDRDRSAFLIIENSKLGRRHETVGYTLEQAKDNFAMQHGYDGWAEMRALAPEGDCEDWAVSWTDGAPDERGKIVAERRAIDALAGSDGIEQPSDR